MARSRRGGPRVGQVGASYTNRSDLQSGPRVLAPSAAPNQTYGKAGEQLASQRVVPMGSPPPPAVAAGAGAGSAAPAPAFNPGQGPDLLRPTEFPDQPLTHGSPSGPGPGPAPGPNPAQSLGQFLDQMAQGPNSNPEVQFLAQFVKGGRL